MYINDIYQHEELLNSLEREYGYFSFDSLYEMIETFGDDFEIIMDTYERGRQIITLRELSELESEDENLFDDIRSVFIHGDDLQQIITLKNEINN